MAYDFNGTNQYLSTATPPATSEPITMSVLFNTDRASGFETLQSIGSNTATSLNILFCYIENLVFYVERSGGTGGGAGFASTGSISTGAWSSAAGVFASVSSRTPYFSGTAGTANTTTVSNLTDPTRFVIGARRRSAIDGYFDGRISEVAVWTAALTAAEITSLSKGFKPHRIRPQSLVFYAPLIRDLQDTKGALAITNNNSATVAVHPRVI